MAQDIFDMHIETLKILNAEMERLHKLIESDNGDDIHVYQAQLGKLHDELCRLSEAYSDKECE